MTQAKQAAPAHDRPGSVAIIGSGPSGCYTAIALRKLVPGVEVAVFDGRATPYGLVRYGVAPDHQGMKGVSRQFERLFAAPDVHFVGNTLVGRDVGVEELAAAFDVIVLATGLAQDRPLNIPCDPQARILGAGEVLRFLNADPDASLRQMESPLASIGSEIVVIGAGNVAMDLIRLFSKTDEELAGSDIDDEARHALGTAHVRRITLLARGPQDRPRWDAAMFAEVRALPRVQVTIDGEMVADRDPEAVGDPVDIAIEFNRTPVAITYEAGRTVVQACSTDAPGVEHAYPAGSVMTATGFVAPPATELEWAAHTDRLVRVGGCRTGALGTLAENRTNAKAAADEVAQHLQASSGRPGWSSLSPALRHDVTDFADWTAVDRAEVARAHPSRTRAKFTTREEMAAVIGEHRATTARPVQADDGPAGESAP